MASVEVKRLSAQIKAKALDLGFDLIGFVPSRKLAEQEEHLHLWLEKKMNADMSYLSGKIKERLNPELLFPGAKSVIVAGMNYFPPVLQGGDGVPVISKYAYGEDYHIVLKEKLKNLLDHIVSVDGSASGKICVDSSPVLEKAWAHEAGLGWIGKNSLLLNIKYGSFVFLGEIILNLELDYVDSRPDDNCGNCDLCVRSCPTGAINNDRTIDAAKCISWLTVENKDDIPEEYRTKINNRIFGCDICQDVCPWNKNLSPHNNFRFSLNEEVKNMSFAEWKSMDHNKFERLFSNSPLKRRGYAKIIRNIEFVTG